MSKDACAPQTTKDLLPSLLGYQLRLAQLAVFEDLQQILDDFNLTPSLFGALVIVDANPGLKQTQLAADLRLDRSSVVPMVERLVQRQLLTRERANSDRRSNALRLTAAGHGLLQELVPRVRDHEARFFSAFSDAEKYQLHAFLRRLNDADQQDHQQD